MTTLAVAALEAVACRRVGGLGFALIAAAHCGWVRPPSEGSQLPVGVWSGLVWLQGVLVGCWAQPRAVRSCRVVRQKDNSNVLCCV